MKRHQKRYFNLIEITMAIAVVGIGISGIVALFPPAIEANKSADFNNFTGGVVNNMAAFIESKIKSDWNGWGTGSSYISTAQPTPAVQTPATIESWTQQTGFEGIWQIPGSTSVFGVKSTDGSIVAQMSVWRAATADALTSYDPAGTSPVAITNSDRVKVFIELSWPVVIAYADRNKQLFVYEFSKP